VLQQLLLQGTTGLYEEAAIDGLMGHVVVLVVWVRTPEPSGNLLWRPLQLELACHDARQRSVLNQFTDFGTLRPIPRKLIGMTCPVAIWSAVTLDFAADRGRSS
jgi:hypothetical protein